MATRQKDIRFHSLDKLTFSLSELGVLLRMMLGYFIKTKSGVTERYWNIAFGRQSSFEREVFEEIAHEIIKARLKMSVG